MVAWGHHGWWWQLGVRDVCGQTPKQFCQRRFSLHSANSYCRCYWRAGNVEWHKYHQPNLKRTPFHRGLIQLQIWKSWGHCLVTIGRLDLACYLAPTDWPRVRFMACFRWDWYHGIPRNLHILPRRQQHLWLDSPLGSLMAKWSVLLDSRWLYWKWIPWWCHAHLRPRLDWRRSLHLLG